MVEPDFRHRPTRADREHDTTISVLLRGRPEVWWEEKDLEPPAASAAIRVCNIYKMASLRQQEADYGYGGPAGVNPA